MNPQSAKRLDQGSTAHLTAIGLNPSNRTLTGTGTTIAVLDTGVAPHPELETRLLTSLGYDFTAPQQDASQDGFRASSGGVEGHGTPIAVLAAGAESGVAPGAQVLPVKVCDDNGNCTASNIVAGVCHALGTAPDGPGNLVLNMSLGGKREVAALGAVLAFAGQSGAMVATSMGNDGTVDQLQYPAAYSSTMNHLVAVGAVSGGIADAQPWPNSNQGNYVDIAAPGVGLTSGNPVGDYGTAYTGTSFATPLVAGALALWKEANPTWTPAQVKDGIKGSASNSSGLATQAVGAGVLNLSEEPQAPAEP